MLRVEVATYENSSEFNKKNDLRIYYTVCLQNPEDDSYCELTADEASGNLGAGSGVEMLELSLSTEFVEENDISTTRTLIGTIDHV